MEIDHLNKPFKFNNKTVEDIKSELARGGIKTVIKYEQGSSWEFKAVKYLL